MLFRSGWTFCVAVVVIITRIPVVLSALTTYASMFTYQHPTYHRGGNVASFQYYEALEVTVTTSDNFTFWSNSSFDLYGYFYNQTFDPLSPQLNLITFNDDSGGNGQFLFFALLDPGRPYILVATTYSGNVTCSFSVTASGPTGVIQINGSAVQMAPTTTYIPIHPVITSQFITTSTTQPLSCSPPTIQLIPERTSLNSSAQFRRTQDFYISSNIGLHCPSSLSMITQWTVYQCNSTCSTPVQLGQVVATTNSELFIPARTLDIGVYQLKLVVAMAVAPSMTSSASAYVRITPSGISANLVPLGTSMITSGQHADLLFDPGTYSDDLDAGTFNSSNWDYAYYCRPYHLYNAISPIPLQSIDQANHQCFVNQLNNHTAIRYNTVTGTKSSVTILAGSLGLNVTYQFVVFMIHRQNPSMQAASYVLVKVEDARPQLIAVACVISTMCSSNLEYQFVNPTTQVALFSFCIGDCFSLANITWEIYEGQLNTSVNVVSWKLFSGMRTPHDDRFFGLHTSNMTATNKLFLDNPSIYHWRFQAVYTFAAGSSSSALNFVINQSPRNGSCSIYPTNGTTSTAFDLHCSNWFDEDGIKDYSFYAWATDPSKAVMLASTVSPRSQLRLPAGDNSTSTINVIVYIRDSLYCITQYNLSSMSVTPDTNEVHALVSVLQETNVAVINQNPVIQLLSGGNQNIISQVLTTLSQIFNEVNNQNVEDAVSNGVPSASISIPSLGSRAQPQSLAPSNASAFDAFKQQLNQQANVRDNLIAYATNLPITTSESIKLQASTLAKLTEATNQLTRNTLMLASSKCYRLSQTLLSMAAKISCEDVQQAATNIAQCATSVLSAVNGPLQQRGTVLDRDFDRANTLPKDYDTDLESEWANERLFADGDDFSVDTVQRGRNKYYQQQMASAVATEVAKIFTSITAALNIHLNVGQTMTMNTSSVFASMEATSPQSLSNKLVEQVAGARIRLPTIFNLVANDNDTIIVRSTMQPLAAAGNARVGPATNLSTSISLSLLDGHGNDIPIHADVDQPIELIVPRDPSTIVPSMTVQNVTRATKHNQSFNLHFINISRKDNLSVSVHIEIGPLNASLAYWFVYAFDGAPLMNSSIKPDSRWQLFCPLDLTADGLYSYFIDNQEASSHQSVVFGLRELNATEAPVFCSNNSTTNSSRFTLETPFSFTANYELRTYTSGCYYLDSNNHWQSDGLVVGPQTNHHQTQCFSTHLTTFASGFLVLPAPINWSYAFANADFAKNKTVYLTLICVCTLYLLFTIYARLQDKKDLLKMGITLLPDNHKADRYFYQIIIFTGHRKQAGTTSKVQFVLGGDDDETSVRTLADRQRPILQRSGVDAFIMAVPRSLGALNYLRIWHDNSGVASKASWFLKYVVVRDLHTMRKSHFICQRWLAVEKDDGAIERLLPVAGDDEKVRFGYALSKQAYHSMSDGHLWFSIFARPPSSKFTRVQRCTCCFVLLFITMFLNIMYYDRIEETKSAKAASGFSIGPFHISTQQVGIGVVVEVISFIPSLLLVQLFRRTRQRISDQARLASIYQALQLSVGRQESIRRSKGKKPSALTLPWWCIFVTYGLSLILIAMSTFFIVVRGIEFGDLKTQKWLTSLVVGFFSSVCLTQPIKVACLILIFSLFVRSGDDDQKMAGYIDNEDDLDLANKDDDTKQQTARGPSEFIIRRRALTTRLSKYEVEEARTVRRKHIRMWSLLREALSYLCFLWAAYALTCSNRSNNAFQQVNHMRRFFLNTGHAQNDYNKIISVNEYWSWLESSFAENIRAQKWYNDDQPQHLNGFTNDKSSRLIGWPTIRQLRVKPESCKAQSFIRNQNASCESDYSWLNEEQRSFQPGWVDHTPFNYSSTIRQAYLYQTSKQLDTHVYVGTHGTYGSGGYVYEFRGRLADIRTNLSQLHELAWIDGKTRAVIVQCTLYNPNVQLFTALTFLGEFLSTGGIVASARFEPIHLQDFGSLFDVIVGVVYMAFIVYFITVEVRTMRELRWRYLRQVWSYIEWGMIGCSWASVGVFVWRHVEMQRIGELFGRTRGYAAVNMQLATYMNDVLTFLLGFCCFFGTVKLLRFCRYHRRLSLLGDTLRYVGKDLCYFTMSFSILFMAFVVLFYFLFASKIWACASLLHSIQMLFEMILMKFDESEIQGADGLLGPLCFVLFIFFVVFVGMTMFISIISDGFRTIRQKSLLNQDEDHQMLHFIWDRFQRWTGWKKLNEWDMQEETDRRMRSEYHDPIERFPEKIDQLLEQLNEIYSRHQVRRPHDPTRDFDEIR